MSLYAQECAQGINNVMYLDTLRIRKKRHWQDEYSKIIQFVHVCESKRHKCASCAW